MLRNFAALYVGYCTSGEVVFGCNESSAKRNSIKIVHNAVQSNIINIISLQAKNTFWNLSRCKWLHFFQVWWTKWKPRMSNFFRILHVPKFQSWFTSDRVVQK